MRVPGASPRERLRGYVATLRSEPRFLWFLGRQWVIVTPGIRAGDESRGGGSGGHVGAPRSNDDQVRTATPSAAIAAGADYLVVGRPITAAPDPVAAARAIVAEIESAARG